MLHLAKPRRHNTEVILGLLLDAPLPQPYDVGPRPGRALATTTSLPSLDRSPSPTSSWSQERYAHDLLCLYVTYCSVLQATMTTSHL